MPFRLRPALEIVATEQDTSTAINRLNAFALAETGSRHAMTGVLNDELGALELAHGTGVEWAQRLDSRTLTIDVGMRDGIMAYVAATGASVFTNNVEDEPRYRNLFGATLSEIAVPIFDRYGRIRAVFNVESDKLDAYSTADYDFCEDVALLIGVVLEREEREAEKEALIEIGNALDTAVSEEELIARVTHIAKDVLRFQAFSIFLYDAQRELYLLRGSIGPLSDKVEQIGYKKGEGCTGWVCEFGESIRLEVEPQKDPRWRARHVEFPGDEVASFLCVPVLYRGRSIGALRAVRHESVNRYLDNRFTESDEIILQAIADQLGTGLEHVRFFQKQMQSERMIAWGELSAKSSHMIGNRVFALKGDVNELRHLLDESTPDLNEIRLLQKSLDTNVTRVEEILQDFRDFLTATKLETAPTNAVELIEETLQEVFPRRSPVVLERDFQPVPPILADAKKLRRAISELIENSFNYVSDGRIRVATAIASREEIRLGSGSQAIKYVKIEIEDSGPGVNTEKKALIFQPFFSGRVKGMGLGLSIVKGIVDAHGGAIFEAGEEGKGAKFVILLPVAERS